MVYSLVGEAGLNLLEIWDGESKVSNDEFLQNCYKATNTHFKELFS